MNRPVRAGLTWGLATFLFLAFGMNVIAWSFYELSNLLDSPSIYLIYSAFRGADHFLGISEVRIWIYAIAITLISAFAYFTSRRKLNKHG